MSHIRKILEADRAGLSERQAALKRRFAYQQEQAASTMTDLKEVEDALREVQAEINRLDGKNLKLVVNP